MSSAQAARAAAVGEAARAPVEFQPHRNLARVRGNRRSDSQGTFRSALAAGRSAARRARAGRAVRSFAQHSARGAALAGKLPACCACKRARRGGAFVRESTGDAIITGLRDMFHLGAIQPEHLTEARVMIESIAVRAACERATPEDIEALNANIAAARTRRARED